MRARRHGGLRTIALASVVALGQLAEAERGHARNAAAAPTIAFALPGGAGGIGIVRLDGTGRRLLTRYGWSPTWSPDGRWIAFITDRDAWKAGECEELERGDIICPLDVYVMRADGSGQRQLTTNRRRWPRSATDHISWSPDSRALAVSVSVGEKHRIEILSVEGKSPWLLTKNHGWDEWLPAWSPSGDTIAFSAESREGMAADIVAVDVSTGQQRFLTRTPVGFEQQDTLATWSPRGTEVAFVNKRGTFVRASTGGVHRVGPEAATVEWSRKGDELLLLQPYEGKKCGSSTNRTIVVRLNVAARRYVRGACGASSPTWTADGRHLLVERNGRGVVHERDSNASYDTDIWTISRQGTLRLVTRHAEMPAPRP